MTDKEEQDNTLLPHTKLLKDWQGEKKKQRVSNNPATSKLRGRVGESKYVREI